MFVLTFRDVERTVVAEARLKIGSKVTVKATAWAATPRSR